MSIIFLTLYKATWAFLQMTQNCITQSVYQRTPQFYRMSAVLQWCVTWLSFLNLPKCYHSTIGHSSSNTEYFFSSENDGMLTRISTVTEEIDLGIVFDGDLKFASHVNQIVLKANRVLGIIKHIPLPLEMLTL